MLASTEISIVTPALRALGNVVTGSDQQTEAVIHAGCIPVICSLLSHSKVSFLVQTFLTIGKGRSGGTVFRVFYLHPKNPRFNGVYVVRVPSLTGIAVFCLPS